MTGTHNTAARYCIHGTPMNEDCVMCGHVQRIRRNEEGFTHAKLVERLRGRKVSVSANDLRQAADIIEAKRTGATACEYAKDLATGKEGEEFPACARPPLLTISNGEWEERVCVDHAMILVHEYAKDLDEQGIEYC